MWILSDVRAFTAGKNLWASAHRQASVTLTNYALFNNEEDYHRFYKEMKIVYGDRMGFEAILAEVPDKEKAIKGWIIGGVEPYDAYRAATTYLRFQWFPKMQEAMDAWRQADQELKKLDLLNEELKSRLKSGPLSDVEKKQTLRRIAVITEKTAIHERAFDDRFSEMARLLIRVLSGSMALLGVLLIITGFLIARLIAKNLVANLVKLKSASKRIASGDFNTQIKIDSKDEVGDLARQFASMAEARKVAEDDLESRAIELVNANEKMAESEKLKSEFFATVSHELRTPLTLILTPLESLLSDENNISKEKLEATLQVMHNNSIRLLQMITSLLDFSKFEAGKMKIQQESINIVELTQTILNDFKPTFSRKEIKHSFNADFNSIIQMDRYIYERILFNLLSNACKFTPSGGTIDVDLELSNDLLSLSVKDTGIGIALEDQKYLFEKFRQVEGASTRRFEGTGLGLNLVKEFAGALGGSIQVESQPGKGSNFKVSLKTKVAENTKAIDIGNGKSIIQQYQTGGLTQSSKQQSKEQKKRLLGTRILIAEDNPELAAYISDLVEQVAEVKIAENGKLALDVMSEWRPDLVISDVMMPEMDGLAFTKVLKKNNETSHIPVILLTALTHREALIKGWEAGADEYLFKPFHPKELVTRVKSVLELAIARRKTLMNSKLASLGEMAGGIAHEINNPLAVIQGHAMRLQKILDHKEGKDFEKMNKSSQKILDLVNRISKIIKGLTDFARDGSGDSKAEISISEAVGTAIELVHHKFEKAKVKLVLENQISHLKVTASETQFVQVLVNILNNACFAAGESKEKWVKVQIGTENDFVTVKIEDSGKGIPEEFIHKLFDPFFTSKEVGKGTGLGLSISRTIIENHGGELIIDSKKEPTRFKIKLPIAMKAVA